MENDSFLSLYFFDFWIQCVKGHICSSQRYALKLPPLFHHPCLTCSIYYHSIENLWIIYLKPLHNLLHGEYPNKEHILTSLFCSLSMCVFLPSPQYHFLYFCFEFHQGQWFLGMVVLKIMMFDIFCK